MRDAGLLPDRAYLAELCRPWKLVTFAVGMSWLLYGALSYEIPDWDVGISLLMGGLTYLCAPWSVATILATARIRAWPWICASVVALFVAWVVVDGIYGIIGDRPRFSETGSWMLYNFRSCLSVWSHLVPHLL